MKRLWLLVFIFYGCSVFTPLQKGKLISLYHLIETGKYEDAKNLAEEMVEGGESAQWANTWYARGLLCQTAYKEGIEKNDPKLFELYPGQLYVAWESYEKARRIDKRERLQHTLSPKYVTLANDFQVLGYNELKKGNFKEALKAFEQTLTIEKLPFLALKQDTLLIYNTALAAFRSQEWNKAVKYFSKLHQYRYSPNATHLLFSANMMAGDTAAAEKVLYQGLSYYNYQEEIVLLLVQALYDDNRISEAVTVINKAISRNNKTASFHYSKGLLYQKTNNYQMAIGAYRNAVKLDPANLLTYVNIATCYYNIGVRHEEEALKLTNKRAVIAKREKSDEAMEAATSWLDRAIQQQPGDPEVLQKIVNLFEAMGKPQKAQRLLLNNQ